MSIMLQTEKLTFAYPAEDGGQQETSALREVDLEIEKGSFVVVLGHNGSGKSTLAKHMNAVLLPTGGKVWVEEWTPRMPSCCWRYGGALAWCSRTRITRSSRTS